MEAKIFQRHGCQQLDLARSETAS
uniref:Uncharacterized protein n=1 Tax=Anguilla anguilla TaxID=7936 RepID=A0A0E9TPS1_ANGAN